MNNVHTAINNKPLKKRVVRCMDVWRPVPVFLVGACIAALTACTHIPLWPAADTTEKQPDAPTVQETDKSLPPVATAHPVQGNVAPVTDHPASAPTQPPPPETAVAAPAATQTTEMAAPASATPSRSASAEAANFYVNMGAFAMATNASHAYKKALDAGIAVFTQELETPQGKLTRVRAGPYTTRSEADAMVKKVRALGLDAVVMRQ